MAPRFMFFEQKWLRAPNTHSKNTGRSYGFGGKITDLVSLRHRPNIQGTMLSRYLDIWRDAWVGGIIL